MPAITAAAAADLFRAAPERFLDVGAGAVAYRKVGTGPDVLFVHGWPVSGATFRTLLPYLADQVTCHLIDLPGAGSSRFDAATTLTVREHVRSVRRVLDLLGLDRVAVVGHDSGGLIARHALAGDPRLRAMGLINTEQPTGTSAGGSVRSSPSAISSGGRGVGWMVGQPRLRRSRLVLGDAFADRSLLDGEFDEFFLRPLHTSRATGMRRRGCCAASTTSSSTSSARCTGASPSRSSWCGATAIRSSRCRGPGRWLQPSPTPASP